MVSIFEVGYGSRIKDWLVRQGVSETEIEINPKGNISDTSGAILVLSDISSAIQNTPTDKLSETINTWIKYSKYAIIPDKYGITYISYNKWVGSSLYRHEIAEKLKIKIQKEYFSDEIRILRDSLYSWKYTKESLYDVVDKYASRATVIDGDLFKEAKIYTPTVGGSGVNQFNQLPTRIDTSKRLIYIKDHGAIGESVFLAYIVDALGAMDKYRICVPENPILSNNPNVYKYMSLDEATKSGIPIYDTNRHECLEFKFRVSTEGSRAYGCGMDLIEMTREVLSSKLGERIRPTSFKSPIYLTEEEKIKTPLLDGVEKYWVIFGTAVQRTKFWGRENIQNLINSLKGEVTFVNVGISGILGGEYDGCINLIDKLSIRELLSVIYNSDGVVSSVGAGHNLGCAVPSKSVRQRQVIGIFGGSEEAALYPYPNLHAFTMIGKYDCCATVGCYQTGVGSVCQQPLDEFDTPPCYNDVKVDQVASLVRSYNEVTTPIKFQEFHASTIYDIESIECDSCRLFSDWIRSQIGEHAYRDIGVNYGFRSKSINLVDENKMYNSDGTHKGGLPKPMVLNRGGRRDVPISGCSADKIKRIGIYRDFENTVAVVYEAMKKRTSSEDTLLRSIRDNVRGGWRYLSSENLSDGLMRISFERFLTNKQYRDQIAKELELPNRTDEVLNGVDLDDALFKWSYSDDYMVNLLKSIKNVL